jgi:hypothetical protein
LGYKLGRAQGPKFSRRNLNIMATKKKAAKKKAKKK